MNFINGLRKYINLIIYSWSTWDWAKNTNRKGIWIELDEEYFKIAEQRINN